MKWYLGAECGDVRETYLVKNWQELMLYKYKDNMFDVVGSPWESMRFYIHSIHSLSISWVPSMYLALF